MDYSIDTICNIVHGTFLSRKEECQIEHLVFDSRRLLQPSTSLFFALRTEHNDGHLYVMDAWEKGIRNFIISEEAYAGKIGQSNVILVENTLDALHQLAAYHRSEFSFPVIGITGSNGKTIVKEWLNQLLQGEYRIVRSPKSYNSQIGVPLSVWQMNSHHTLAIFEAGISKPGEMDALKNIIRPTIGILTNIGSAHSEGFMDDAEKLAEKLKLFADCPLLITRNKDIGGKKELLSPGTKIISWGNAGSNDLKVVEVRRTKQTTEILLSFDGKEIDYRIPFTDEASIENSITCCTLMLVLKYQPETIRVRMKQLHAIDMRLKMNQSFNDCLVINDSYSADLTSLKIALDFMKQQASGLSPVVILSELAESGISDDELFLSLSTLINDHGVKKVIAIGERLGEGLPPFLKPGTIFHSYLSTDDFIHEFRSSQFNHEIILIKGARKFEFERIAKLFERKQHQTVLQINLNALAHNLKEYQRILKPGTKIMAMVKAFSYGSGGPEIASVLQYHHADYLGVAYGDEGVDLVKSGIHLPIMVMNAEASSFSSIVDFQLQPVLYSFELLHEFEYYLKEQGLNNYPVHLEIETGMNRLGFSLNDIPALGRHLASTSIFSVQSVFSHLAASEDEAQDEFTNRQADHFLDAVHQLKEYLPYSFLVHMSNSAAIIRHPELQMDMVRLGIGLYGIEISNASLQLQPVATLKATIAQIKHVKKGESISYNRRSIVERDSVIATVRIGYADGFSRRFGNGVGSMWVKGCRAKVIGTVCMDMTMLDVTDIPGVEVGGEVIVFGPELPVQEVASWIGTIPYEIMTGISHRVRRVYFHE